jgi:hypothetical protein
MSAPTQRRPGPQGLPPRERRILPPQERERLEAELESRLEDKKFKPGKHTWQPERVNDPRERAMIQRIKKTLDNGTPGSLSASEKSRLESEAKTLRGWLRSKMLTRRQASLRAGPDPAFRKAVNQMAQNENSLEFVRRAERWKNIMRQLDPDDPNVANLETIRPD